MKPTIRDVARTAGVSPATVSLVLNNRSGIGEKTRKTVLEAAESLGYRYQKKGTAEEGRGTLCFLKVVRHGHILNRDHNEFISDYIEGIQQEAGREGFSLEVRNYESTEPADILVDLQDSSFSGLIILATELSGEEMECFSTSPFPVVFIDASHPSLPFDFIDMDNEGAVYSIVKTFKELGHTKIGMVTASHKTRNFALREKYFHEAMEHCGLAVESRWIFCADSTIDHSFDDILPQLKSKRGDLPSALFCVCDIIAYGTLRALRELDISVPEAVSVIGFDNLLSSQVTDPPLASIEVSKKSIGRKAGGLLLRRIAMQEELPYEKVCIGSTLVRRASLK